MVIRPHLTSRAPVHNSDVSWDDFDTQGYLVDNYTLLHNFDRRIITSLSPYYRALPPRSLASSLDVGTGPNIYPLMLVAGASRSAHALDLSDSNIDYLRRVSRQGAGHAWHPFWQLCRQLNYALPPDLDEVLRGLTVEHGSILDLPAAQHDLVSMFFVAESVTGDSEEFQELCQRFARSARAGGYLIAAFMAGMPDYRLAGETLPALSIDQADVEIALRQFTRDLHVRHLPADPTLPYQHDGVLLLTARAVAYR